uniref:Uncharacterized protein n=1 Tax=Leishmania guyanensis TaxID=5670 RepID=A0A1E1ITC5_LEIGU|nr:hypothetical protein, conserved [Leishmania guyanensis]
MPVRFSLRVFSSHYHCPYRLTRAYAGSAQFSSHTSGVRRCTACTARTYSVQAYTHAEDAEADEEDYLEAYEELLLSAASSAEADGAAQPSDASTAGIVHLEDGVHVDGAFLPFGHPAPVLSPADALVEDTLAALPADGSPVLLTDLTLSLDVEAISELFGSVRSFVQLHPHRFTCGQDAATCRWHVARVLPSTSSLSATAAAGVPGLASAVGRSARDDHKTTVVDLDMAAMALEEEVMRVCGSHHTPQTSVLESEAALSTAKRSRRRLTPVLAPPPPTPSPGTDAARDGASLAIRDARWSAIANLLPEDGTPLSIAVLRASLPESIAQELSTSQVGLARCFKQNYATASRYVALTTDATALVRAVVPHGKSSAVASVSLWSPEHQHAAFTNCKESSVVAFSSAVSDIADGSYVPPPADYDASLDAEPWLVTISLDEGEETRSEGEYCESGDVEEGELEPSTGTAAALAAATALQEVPYSGLDGASGLAVTQGHGAGLQLHNLNLERLYDAPAPPTAIKPKPSTAAQLPRPAGAVCKERPSRPSTPAQWLALHTAMAEARGWITPMQMLDYLVECVPTFFIPIEELRPSDAILKLVGARTSMRTLVCRVYMYFVERSEDKMQVRLAPTVKHAQRGAANVHYPEWIRETVAEHEQRGADATPSEASTPADAGTDTAANPGDRQGSATYRSTRSGGAVLQSSDTTRAFPVMRVRRPIKSLLCARSFKSLSATVRTTASPEALPTAMRLSSPGRQADASTGTRGGSTLTIHKGDCGVIALSSVPTGEIGYPFLALATQPADAWPWWAKLLCVLPFDTYVPLGHLCIHYCPGLAPDHVHRAWRATDASLPPTTSTGNTHTPIPLSLLRAPTTSRKVRLRPFWLSPGCTAELESTVMPAGLVKQLRPAWLSVSRVLAKLTPEAREESFALALRRPSAAGLSAEEALVMVLRDCGRGCWVQEDGAKVRQYAASSALDDHFHASLSLLYGFSSAHAWEPLPTVLDRAAEHVRSLFAHSQAPPLASPNTVGLIGMLRQAPPAELKAFLTRHAQWLQVKATDGSETSDGAAAQLLVRRRAALVSF